MKCGAGSSYFEPTENDRTDNLNDTVDAENESISKMLQIEEVSPVGGARGARWWASSRSDWLVLGADIAVIPSSVAACLNASRGVSRGNTATSGKHHDNGKTRIFGLKID
jgi:hypothetical protein